MEEWSLRSAYFEDMQVGFEIETPARTITEADIIAFAGLSGDYNPLHTDATFAARGPFGQRIAHGLLGLAITSGLAARLGILEKSVLAFRELSCKFKKPIFIGDTVHAHLKVIEARPMPRIGGGLVSLEVKLYNQHDQVVQSSVWSVLLRSKE